MPDREALVDGSTGIRSTFNDLEVRVRQVAAGLRGIGVEKGDRVAMIETNRGEYVEVIFACALLGAVFVPVNYRARATELAGMFHDISPSAVIGGQRYGRLVAEALETAKSSAVRVTMGEHREQVPYRRLADDFGQVVEPPAGSGDDTAMIMFTSGTSSQPKGVVLSHASFSTYVLSNVAPADPEPDSVERTLLTVPLYHIAGAQALMSGIYGGRTLVLQPQFEPESWLNLIESEKVTRAMVVPTMLKALMERESFADYDLSSLKVITYGAAAMAESVLEKALAKFPNAQFINAFGQTETAATITMLSPEDHRLTGTPGEIEKKRRRLGSVGRPLPDVEVRIVSPDGLPVEQGETGEIVARGQRLMKGYWNRPDATAGAIHGGWLHTGDLGWMDEDGYIFLSGRAREFIKRGGEMISPEEVEEVLNQHPSVAESAVIGLPDEMWGEVAHAVVVPAPQITASAEELIEWCRSRLASFKKPEVVHFVQELPRSQLGKIMKSELRARFHNGS